MLEIATFVLLFLLSSIFLYSKNNITQWHLSHISVMESSKKSYDSEATFVARLNKSKLSLLALETAGYVTSIESWCAKTDWLVLLLYLAMLICLMGTEGRYKAHLEKLVNTIM